MKMDWKSFVSLKAYVLIAFVVIWNAGFLLAMQLGGGGLRGGLTPIGMKITGAVCIAACIFSLLVACIKPIQARLVAPARAHNFNVKEFYFLAFVSGVLGITRFVFPLVGVGSNGF